MMKKSFFQHNAKVMIAFLFTVAMSAGFSACSWDNGENPVTVPSQESMIPQEITEPTDDQMLVKVTSDIPFAVKGQFDDKSMGAALIKRLGTPSPTITDDTKLVLMKGSDIKTLSNEELLSLAKVYCQGGYLAFEKPTAGDMLAFAVGMVVVLVEAENEVLTADGDVTITPDSPQAAPLVTSSEAEQLKGRIASMRAYATRGANEEGDTMQEMLGEMVILARDSYYLRECYKGQKGNFTISDENGNQLLNKEEGIKWDYTNYQSGLMADGAAQWLNSRASSMNERQAEARRLAATRADGSKSINDLMSASDEFTFDLSLYSHNFKGERIRKSDAHHEIIRVWGVHNTKTQKDYYYVQEKVRLSVGGKHGNDYPDDNTSLYKGPEENKLWWEGSYDQDGLNFKWFFGSWLQSFEAELELRGSGSIRVEEAIPTTDNNNVSTSIAIGETHSETNTVGFSLGFSIGKNFSFNPSVNYSHGWTDGTTYTMTTTNNAKELNCKKNTNGANVKWTYECGKNMLSLYRDNDDYWCHQSAPDALINDVDIENQICWSVSNPSGSYRVMNFSKPMMRLLMKVDKAGTHYYWDDWDSTEYTFSLKTPNRVVQEWYMDITFPEIGQAGHHGDKGKLIEYLQRQFPDLYQPRLSLADQTETSEGTIKFLVDYTKKLLLNSDGAQTMRDYALDLGLSQYTIKWYTIDGKHNKYDLVIKAKD